MAEFIFPAGTVLRREFLIAGTKIFAGQLENARLVLPRANTRVPARMMALTGTAGKRFDAMLKYLIALRNLGLNVASPGPTGRRR